MIKHIVVTQPRLVQDDQAGNLHTIGLMARGIAASMPPADVVVLPECFFREPNFLAYEQCVREVAETTNACVIGGSVHARLTPERPLQNVGVVMAPDGHVLATYSKRHPYGKEIGYGVQPGNGLAMFPWRGAQCAVLICADVWDARLLTELSTPPDIFFVVAATVSQEHGPAAARRLWHALAVARAFECVSVVAISDWAVSAVDDQRSTCGVAGLADPCDYTGKFQPIPTRGSWHGFVVDLDKLHHLRAVRYSRHFYFWQSA